VTITLDDHLHDIVEERAATPMGRRALLAKAMATNEGIEESAALQQMTRADAAWGQAAAEAPYYDPEALMRVVEMTAHIQPCIDAIAHNVDGWGHQPVEREAWMRDLDSPEATEAIAAALAVEAWADADAEERAQESETKFLRDRIARTRAARDRRRISQKLQLLDAPADQLPEDPMADQVEAVREDLRETLARERAIFTAWFAQCCSDRSFPALRRAVRTDQLTVGWGCIELLRDRSGRLRRLIYMPSYTVRPLTDLGPYVETEEVDDLTLLGSGSSVPVPRRFPRFVQIADGKRIYFKAPGDQRVVSRSTGAFYPNLEALRKEEEEALPATELLWITRHDARTMCAPPVWIGNLLMALGSREADQTNYYYLSGNAIPSGLLMIYGGTLKDGDVARLEAKWRQQLAGAKGAGRIIVMEAIPSANMAPGETLKQPGMAYQSLRESQTNDATFTVYDQRAADRIGASFRLPPPLRGYTPANLNRATAYAALAFAEQQVFAPQREEFDWLMDQVVLRDLGLRLVRFRSNTPPTRSLDEVSELVKALAPFGGFTPAEVRALAGDALNQPAPPLDADWTKRPLSLTLAGITDDGTPAPNDVAQLNEHLRSIEARVAHLVTDELAQIGLGDYQVRAHVGETPTPDGGGNDR